ncbi:hypothetical protein MHYP_G00214730 [Metynnis hypsauchen]
MEGRNVAGLQWAPGETHLKSSFFCRIDGAEYSSKRSMKMEENIQTNNSVKQFYV